MEFFSSSSSLLTGDSISLSSSFQLSKWTNQSPLTSLFFLLARSPRALSFLVSVASSFSFASSSSFFHYSSSRLSYAPIHPRRIFSSSSLSPLLFSMSPTSQKKLERTQTRWMNAPSESVNRKAEE